MFPDRFGNLVTNVTRADAVAAFGSTPFVVRLGGHDAGPVCPTYASGAGRGLFPIWGSDDRLELSVERGSAARQVARDLWDDLILARQECLAHQD
jgi:S-adenosylmethionine hydrolase